MISNIIEKDFEIIKYKILTINLKLFYNTPIVMDTVNLEKRIIMYVRLFNLE